MPRIIISGGTIIDPGNGLNQISDLLVEGSSIKEISLRIPRQPDDNVIDAKGCFVAPGLIDHHMHLHPMSGIGVPAESVCFGAGVTAAVDAGSTGCANFRDHLYFLEHSWLTVRPYIHICSTGLASLASVPKAMEDVDPERVNEDSIAELFEEFGPRLAGLKVRASREIVGEFGLAPVKKAVSLGDKLGVPIMVHCTNPAGTMKELLSLLRPGDVLTHMYMNQGSTILDENGKVSRAAWEARKRGVLFEAADARAHFGFSTAFPAVEEGFWPDFISTDLTILSMYQRPTSFNLAMQVSRYTFLGIPFSEVIRRCTVNPARNLKLPDGAGTLSIGANADISVFRPVFQSNVFGDRPYGNQFQEVHTGRLVYESVLTVKKGLMVYRSVTF